MMMMMLGVVLVGFFLLLLLLSLKMKNDGEGSKLAFFFSRFISICTDTERTREREITERKREGLLFVALLLSIVFFFCEREEMTESKRERSKIVDRHLLDKGRIDALLEQDRDEDTNRREEQHGEREEEEK